MSGPGQSLLRSPRAHTPRARLTGYDRPSRDPFRLKPTQYTPTELCLLLYRNSDAYQVLNNQSKSNRETVRSVLNYSDFYLVNFEDSKMIHDDARSPLPERIAAFKDDEEAFRQANEFIDQILQHAKTQVETKEKEKERSELEKEETESGMKRRLGRARGLVLRMFDALCNCTQTAAAAARTTARNPFTKR